MAGQENQEHQEHPRDWTAFQNQQRLEDIDDMARTTAGRTGGMGGSPAVMNDGDERDQEDVTDVESDTTRISSTHGTGAMAAGAGNIPHRAWEIGAETEETDDLGRSIAELEREAGNPVNRPTA